LDVEAVLMPQRPHSHHAGAFGSDSFGRAAERFARFFGTPTFIVSQTILVALWIALNASEVAFKPFDAYPFILLNLAFSTQAAYAAPLILLAQTRQADRDLQHAEMMEKSRDAYEERHTALLEQNERLSERIEQLAEQIRQSLRGGTEGP
jgi:uncharacterized membrane protein